LALGNSVDGMRPNAVTYLWLNQAEIVFSIVQKKVISPHDFTSTAQLDTTLLAFIDRYNQTARPLRWKFTAADLASLLERISAHQEPPPSRSACQRPPDEPRRSYGATHLARPSEIVISAGGEGS
jgi:hypothetical protein